MQHLCEPDLTDLKQYIIVRKQKNGFGDYDLVIPDSFDTLEEALKHVYKGHLVFDSKFLILKAEWIK